jgi:hypothetical protein
MKKAVLAIVALLIFLPSPIFAHSGRTDSSGGHNCSDSSISKGLCTGYHYHNGGSAPAPAIQQVAPAPTAVPTIRPTARPTIKPTAKPTIKPTIRPTPVITPIPTLTPIPTIAPTPSPKPEIKGVEATAKKPSNFFEWVISLFF